MYIFDLHVSPTEIHFLKKFTHKLNSYIQYSNILYQAGLIFLFLDSLPTKCSSTNTISSYFFKYIYIFPQDNYAISAIKSMASKQLPSWDLVKSFTINARIKYSEVNNEKTRLGIIMVEMYVIALKLWTNII